MINISCVIAAAILAGGAVVGSASPAAAHGGCASYGANAACVSAGQRMIFWCDRESDGHRVFAQYYADKSSLVTTGVTGNGRGCRQQSDVSKIVRFRVCEIGSGCSAWRRS